jgi:hypothetical protein
LEHQEFKEAVRILTPKDQLLLLEYLLGDQKGHKEFGRTFAAKYGGKPLSVTRQLQRVFDVHWHECHIISSAPRDWQIWALKDHNDPNWRLHEEY